MTNAERVAITKAVERIRYLASMENACFDPFDKEKDAYIKAEVSPYMDWFECVADVLIKIVNIDTFGYRGTLKTDMIQDAAKYL